MEGQLATLFTGIVVVFLIAVLLLIVLYRVKIPSVVAFLIAGFLAGPSGLGLITNEESISFFAELGVIFLLFTIGLEFSVSRIFKSRRYVLIGGGGSGIIYHSHLHRPYADYRDGSCPCLLLGDAGLLVINGHRDEGAC